MTKEQPVLQKTEEGWSAKLEQQQLADREFSRRTLLAAGLGAATIALVGCETTSSSQSDLNSESTGASAETSNSTNSDLPPLPKKDHPAPNFTLATLDGGELTLADFRGKPVILNFWASWCGPCRLEMPHLQETFAERSEELSVVGINLTQRENNMDDVPLFVDEFSLTFPIALDENGDVAQLYEVRGQPASIFIDANGIVRTVFYGPVTKDFIEERITELKNA